MIQERRNVGSSQRFRLVIDKVENVEEKAWGGRRPEWFPRYGDKSAAELQAMQHPLDVSYCQMAKCPEAFVGKEIRVRAACDGAFGLRPVACCAEKPVPIAVGMGDLDARSDKLERRFYGKKTLVIGLVVFMGMLGRGGVYGALESPFHLRVDRIAAVATTALKSQIPPKWVPKNCFPDKGQRARLQPRGS